METNVCSHPLSPIPASNTLLILLQYKTCVTTRRDLNGQLVSTASAICCIGGIGGLSSQRTARLGNVLGMSGVAFGVAATVGTLAPSPAQLAQLVVLMGAGGVGGYQVRTRFHPSQWLYTLKYVRGDTDHVSPGGDRGQEGG